MARRRARSVISPMTSHWEFVDLPLLRAIHEMELEKRTEGTHGKYFDIFEAGERAELSGPDTLAAFENLRDAAFVEFRNPLPGWQVRRLTPAGLEALGEWPSGDQLSAALPRLLEAIAAHVDDEESSGVLKRGADVIQGVATATIAGVVRQVIGLDA